MGVVVFKIADVLVEELELFHGAAAQLAQQEHDLDDLDDSLLVCVDDVVLDVFSLQLLIELGELFHQQPHYLTGKVVQNDLHFDVFVLGILMSNRAVLCLQGLCNLFALFDKSAQPLSYLLTIYMLLQYFGWYFCICQHQAIFSSFQALDEPILLEDVLLED